MLLQINTFLNFRCDYINGVGVLVITVPVSYNYQLKLGNKAKTGEYSSYIPQLSKLRVLLIKHLKDNEHNSSHLARKYARIFVRGHYQYLKAHSFLRDTLHFSEQLMSSDKYHISATKGGYCLLIE